MKSSFKNRIVLKLSCFLLFCLAIYLFIGIILGLKSDEGKHNISYAEKKDISKEDLIIINPRMQVEEYRNEFHYLKGTEGYLSNNENELSYLKNADLDSSFGRIKSKNILINGKDEIIIFENRPIFYIYNK